MQFRVIGWKEKKGDVCRHCAVFILQMTTVMMSHIVVSNLFVFFNFRTSAVMMSHFHFMIRTVKRIHDDNISLEKILSNSINDTVTVHNTDPPTTSLVTPCSYPFYLQICLNS